MPTRFPHGLSSYGIPVFGGLDIPANANVFFVDSGSGSDNNAGDDPANPLATADYANGLCTANNGDHIFFMPGHAETITTPITMDIAGVTLWGWGRGRSMPALTGSGAIDIITVTAANCRIHGLRLIGASASVTAHINVAAADVEIDAVQFDQAETPLSCITIASGDRGYVHDCRVLGTANGPDHFIDIESSGSDNWIVERIFCNWMTNGLDNAVFRANADTASGWIIKDVVAIGLDATCLFIDFNSSAAEVGHGLVVDSACQTLAGATVANLLDLGGMGVVRFAISDGPNRGAILLPATSAT